ncbi:MAG: FAD-dependent oxidoreductase [Candidatus Latescibacterota bacterium]
MSAPWRDRSRRPALPRQRHAITDADERIECQLVGLTAGVGPNIDLVADCAIETGRGVLVDWSLRTNVPDVLAAGDCAEIVTHGDGRNLLQQVWYTGKRQARVAARVLAGMEVAYDPGVWYNSAKFLDLEYHTYG